MPVRDEDRNAAGAEPREFQPKVCGIAARVDDDRLVGRLRGTDDVAIRPDRAELVAIDDQAHRALTGG